MADKENPQVEDEVSARPLATPYEGGYRQTLDDEDEEDLVSAETVTQQGEDTEDVVTPKALDDPEKSEEETWKKRYGDLKSYHDKTVNQFNTRVDGLETELSKVNLQDIPLPKSDDEIEEWRKEYPEVYDIMVSVAKKNARDEDKKLEQKFGELEKREAKLTRNSALAALLKKHPDFSEYREDEDKALELHDWAKEQPEEIYNWIYTGNDPILAARAFDLFKKDKGLDKPKRKKQDNESAAEAVSRTKTVEDPQGKKKKIWTESEIKQLTPAEFEKLEKEIDEAAYEGRIEHDMTPSTLR